MPTDLFATDAAQTSEPKDLFAGTPDVPAPVDQSAAPAQPSDTFMTRVVNDAAKRQQTVQGLEADSPVLAGSKAVGQAAGFLANDLPGEAMKSAYDALPEHVQEGIKNSEGLLSSLPLPISSTGLRAGV